MSDDLTWLEPKRITSIYTEEEKQMMQPKSPGRNLATLGEHVRKMGEVHRAMASFPVIPDTYEFTGLHPEYGGLGTIPDRLYVTPTEKVRYVYHDGYRRWSKVTTALDSALDSDVWPTPAWARKTLEDIAYDHYDEHNSLRAMIARTDYSRPNPAGQIPKSAGHIQGIAADPLSEANKRDIKLDKNGNIVMVTHDEMVFEIEKRLDFHTEDCKGTGCKCGRRHAKSIRFTPEIPGFPSVHVSVDPGFVSAGSMLAPWTGSVPKEQPLPIPSDIYIVPDQHELTRKEFDTLKGTADVIGVPIKVKGKVGEVTRIDSFEEYIKVFGEKPEINIEAIRQGGKPLKDGWTVHQLPTQNLIDACGNFGPHCEYGVVNPCSRHRAPGDLRSVAESLPERIQKRYAETKLRHDYYGTVTAEDINMSAKPNLEHLSKIRAELATAEWDALSSSERTARMQAIYDGFNNRQKRTFAKFLGPGYCGVDTTIDVDYASLEKRTAEIMYARYLAHQKEIGNKGPYLYQCAKGVISPPTTSVKAQDDRISRWDRGPAIPPVPTEIAKMRDKFCTRLNKLFESRARVSFPPTRSPDFTVLLKLADNHLIDPPRLTFDFPIRAIGDDFSIMEDHVVRCVNIMLDGYKRA